MLGETSKLSVLVKELLCKTTVYVSFIFGLLTVNSMSGSGGNFLFMPSMECTLFSVCILLVFQQ